MNTTTRARARKPRKSSRGSAGKPNKNVYRAKRSPFDLPTAVLTVGGLGFMRPASGTWGSLPPAILAVLLLVAGASAMWMTIIMLAVLLLASAGCVYWGRYAVTRFGRKDAAEVVADETAGCAMVFLFWPASVIHDTTVLGAAGDDPLRGFILSAVLAGAGFAAFRVFDIIKPPPASKLEALPFGWGVLLDDLAAAAFALAVMQALTRFVL